MFLRALAEQGVSESDMGIAAREVVPFHRVGTVGASEADMGWVALH